MSTEYPAPPAGAGVWPPPPTNTPDDGRSRQLALLAQYRSPTMLSRFMLVCLAGAVLLEVISAVELLLGASAMTMSRGVAQLASTMATATGVLFLCWIHRLYKNLPCLGVSGLRYSPGVAVVMFLLPIINIYKPIVIVREIWRATSPPEVLAAVNGSWRKAPSSPLIGLWWIAFYLYDTLGAITSFNASRTRVFDVTPYEATAVGAVISGALFAIVARRLTQREKRRYRELSASLRN